MNRIFHKHKNQKQYTICHHGWRRYSFRWCLRIVRSHWKVSIYIFIFGNIVALNFAQFYGYSVQWCQLIWMLALFCGCYIYRLYQITKHEYIVYKHLYHTAFECVEYHISNVPQLNQIKESNHRSNWLWIELNHLRTMIFFWLYRKKKTKKIFLDSTEVRSQ